MTNTARNTFKQTSRLAELWDELRSDPVPPRPPARLAGRDPASSPSDLEGPPLPVTRSWRNSLGKVWQTLMELENTEPDPLSIDPANSEHAEMSIEAAHEEALALMSPFRWDPKPAWTSAPLPQRPPLSSTAMPHRAVTRPRIPLRPLHKRPFYKRFFFYLQHWLSNPK
jgi:hypothetical protein